MYDLVVFSQVRWDFVYQRPQQLLSRLARGRRVFFVEEPEHAPAPVCMRVSSPCAGVTVLRARTPLDSTGFNDEQLSVMAPLLRRSLADRGVRGAVAWFCTPMALPLLREMDTPRAVVYDCADESSALDLAPQKWRQRESELMLRADLVFTGEPGLCEAKRKRHAHVHCFPSAVDAAHFAPAGTWAADAETTHPRLGYFGVIDERLDMALIATLAKVEPNWQIVMVGPVLRIDPSSLPRAPNIHWLGPKPYAVLPSLVQDWQVCLLPFALNAATRFKGATRTLEYMAAEKPVVSTGLPDVVSLYGEQIRVAGDTGKFISMCRAALAEDATQGSIRSARMRAAVARTSWDRTADVMRRLIDAVAGKQAVGVILQTTHVD